MRILCTSDLHYGHHHAEACREYAATVLRDPPDVLVIAGDVGEGLPRFRACLELFRDLPATTTKLVVAGNHDVWRHDDVPRTSLELLETDLPREARAAGFAWLETETVIREGTAFVGSVGWYDYSGCYEEPRPSRETIVAWKRRAFVDAWRIDWPLSDEQMSESCARALEARMEAASAREDVRRVFLVTHVPPWAGDLPRPPRYQRSAAFFVNLTLGRRLERFEKLSHAVAGHVHMGARCALSRPSGPPIEYRVIPSDYGDPRSVWVEVE